MNPSPFSPLSSPSTQAGYYASPVSLSAVMRQVYLWLAMGLAICFGIAFALGHEVQRELATAQDVTDLRLRTSLFSPVVLLIAIIAYIVIGFAFFPVVQRASVAVGATLYVVFAALFGFMTSTAFLQYTSGTILSAFLVTGGMFAVMSLIGYTTRIDLSRFRAILFMGVIGIIIASLVNFFLHSEAVYWLVTYAGVVIFAGLTAYDTQWIKRTAATASLSGSAQTQTRVALLGAFKLFLDFVNLFLFVLRILGRSGRN
jgi:FtsH-binding integral membrane protein